MHCICSLKSNRPLRSLGSSQLEITRVHTKQGESAFSYYAACSWNQLSEETRCAKILATFKSRLKTHLFSIAFVEWALWLYHFPCCYCCDYYFEWLFHCLLYKALWITTVYEMCYINKLALPLDLSVETLTEKANIKIFGDIFYFLEGAELSSLLLYHYVYIGCHFIIIMQIKKINQVKVW